MKKGLTIAGSDSCGGAGIQADLKTFSAHGLFAMSVITAVTAQNTQGVLAVEDLSPQIIGKQIDAIFEDIKVDAVKIGMLSKIDTIMIIGEKLRKYQPENIVLDPIMVSKNGYHLLNPKAVEALIKELFPLSRIVTPNIPEAQVITGINISTIEDMEYAARAIFQMGSRNVLLKGGHLENDPTDLLFDGEKMTYFKGKRINTKNTHGTGCTLSSAIASNLGKGYSIIDSISKAKEYISIAIENSLSIGKGVGPTHHFYTLYKKAGILNE